MLLTQAQEDFDKELRAKTDLTHRTRKKLILGEKCQGAVYRKLQALGVTIPDTALLLHGPRPPVPVYNEKTHTQNGTLRGSRGGRPDKRIPRAETQLQSGATRAETQLQS